MSPAPASPGWPSTSDGAEREVEKVDVPRLVRLSTESKASANEALAGGNLQRAAELYVRGVRRLEAVDLAAHAEAKPLLVALLLNLSLCRLRMDEPIRARNAASRALALEPRLEKGLYRRAEASLRLGEHAAAEADLMTLREEQPENRAAARLLHEVRSRRQAAAATSRQQAVRMLASGRLYAAEMDASTAAPRQAAPADNAEAGGPPVASPAAVAPTDWEREACQRLFLEGKEELYEDVGSLEAPGSTAAAADREPVTLPEDWEVVRDERGAEIWQRRGSLE